MKTALTQGKINWPRVAETLAKEAVIRRFIPLGGPHFGGLLEAGVRSFKTHLRRTVESKNLTYEEFSILLVSIELVLNCRPEPDDLQVLTLGHFLVVGSLASGPQTTTDLDGWERLTHWKLVQGLRAQFWLKWSREYLSTLQQCLEWTVRRPNV